MKVVQINAVCDFGSTGRICRELNDAIIQFGHQGVVLYGDGESQYEYAIKMSNRFCMKVHGFLSRILGKNAAYSPWATRKILNYLSSYKPDIVHLHNLHGNYVNLKQILRYLERENIPVVLTLHDCWFFTGKCVYYTIVNCNKWQTGCHHCPKLRGDIPSWFFDRTEEMWREKKERFSAIPRLAVIGVSDWITGEAKKSFLKDAMILQRIYNWIDLDVFYPRGKEGGRQFGISKDKFSILCIGAGWSENSYKTKDLLTLAGKIPENYEIILAGAVPFADRLPDNIKVVGYVSSTEDLAKLYSACDVYVHLSREDTFGKVIAEAISCGTPAVVYDSTACPEIVGEGCGYIVPPGDLDSALRAIEKLKRNDTETVLKCCRQFALDNFDKEKLINETIAIYENIMN